MSYHLPARSAAPPALRGNQSKGGAPGVVLVVAVLLRRNAESRDYLLGHGKALSMVSLGLLLLVPTMIVVNWSVTY